MLTQCARVNINLFRTGVSGNGGTYRDVVHSKLNLEARQGISRYYAILSRRLSKQLAAELNSEYILTARGFRLARDSAVRSRPRYLHQTVENPSPR